MKDVPARPKPSALDFGLDLGQQTLNAKGAALICRNWRYRRLAGAKLPQVRIRRAMQLADQSQDGTGNAQDACTLARGRGNRSCRRLYASVDSAITSKPSYPRADLVGSEVAVRA